MEDKNGKDVPKEQ